MVLVYCQKKINNGIGLTEISRRWDGKGERLYKGKLASL
jgi:hypothetical protein